MLARIWFVLAFVPWLLLSCAGEEAARPMELETAQRLLAEGRSEEALQLLEAAVESNPESVEHLVLYAEACERLGRVRRGIRALEKARARAPDSPHALYVQALLERDRHRVADAIERIREAIALDPDNATFQLLLGDLALLAADRDGAVDAFARACELEPENVLAHGGWGRALVLAGRHAEGKPLLERYLAVRPTDPQALYLRGLARFRDKEFEAAEADFRAAIDIAPHLPGPYHNLARILQMSGRTEEAATARAKHREVQDRDWAIRGAERELGQRPQDQEAARRLANLLTEAGRTQEAARILARLGTASK